ncbi:cysteine desulfurase family protein [Senegalia massiliensis]|uniref:Cysteine desulfurase n=1 Tax=Senegalia massiliensis TaxID=1720316 RepID=A0A845QV77_9CLOT|nr:cysteine desulfurase family protein [Senegalia massiliensis]NBI06807.1 cysteine desulfurase [Senegalia massiliensis]
MFVYLDNSATTKPRDEVIDEMNILLREDYGNPSSLHRMGLKVEKKIKRGRDIISKYLNVKSSEIYFTSGGTESNNIAIQGIIEANKNKGNHIITSKIEHPSVLNILKNYEQKGFKITYLDVDEYGIIDLNQFKDELLEDTILVSLMMVNNEVGSIQPLEKVKEIINNNKSNAYLHVDGIQALGKIDFNIKKMGIDSFSFSAHKIHGPKGVGCLYIRDGLNIKSIIFGGEQEKGIRSGTENTPGIIGLSKAIEILNSEGNSEKKYLDDLKNYFIEKVKENISDIKINTAYINSAPHIVNISFINTKGEVLLHFLESDDIYVSTGSACSSKDDRGSYVLKSMGLKNVEIESAIRFSFSIYNTKEQIDYVIKKLKLRVEEIRDIMMR